MKRIMNLKGSKTEKNLEIALQDEALAHMKYQFYRSSISNYSKEYEQILDEIVHNEKEHSKIWFNQLHNGKVPDDLDNLLDAYLGEKYEHLDMYPKFSKVAYEEGFDEIGKLFEEVAKIEGYHMLQFENIRKNIIDDIDFYGTIEDGRVYSVRWKCLNCGYQYRGKESLDECPVCNHPNKYFTKLDKE